MIVSFGNISFGDIPISADYDGDGKADIAVRRPSTGVWYSIPSTTGGSTVYTFGASTDIAVPSAYRRRSSSPKNQNKEIPRDGLETLAYDAASNRITTTGFAYDLAGNQTSKVMPDGTVQHMQYDVAGRLIKVKDNNMTTIATYSYGASRNRLITQHGSESSNNFTYYAWEGQSVIAEYSEGTANTLEWAKNYIYMGGTLLATQTKTSGTAESLRFNHSGRLGTQIVTDPNAGTSSEQNTLPFGTALTSETSDDLLGNNRLFTSYDRSASTGLDYAINRFYDSTQGRFTTVDPLKFEASSPMNPQTLNLYGYTANDPINRTDPDGQFWGFIKGVFGFLFGGGTSFNFNFNVNGTTLSFGFNGHFKNIYAGFNGHNIQITGENSIFNQLKKFFKGGIVKIKF